MASHIERRKFLAALGGAAAAWPLGRGRSRANEGASPAFSPMSRGRRSKAYAMGCARSATPTSTCR